LSRVAAVSPVSLYQDVLKEHYLRPRNCGDLHDADVIRRGSNPRCGDDVEVGIYLEGETVRQVRFRGRGCSVCIASASLMTEAVGGKSRDAARELVAEMKRWFSSGDGNQVPDPPQSLRALSAIQDYPARRRCVLLAWEALDDALNAT
jgi:nitrogen fixation NifU-like protein